MVEEQTKEIERLIEDERQFLWYQSLYLTSRKEEAEDLLQETLMKACNGFGCFKHDTNFRAWAKRIMINTHITKSKQKMSNTLPCADSFLNYENASLNSHPDVSNMDDPEKVFFHNHISEEIMDHFCSMPEEFKTVFFLYHFNGYTYEEISRGMNIPFGTVKSRIYRARQYMMEKIRGNSQRMSRGPCRTAGFSLESENLLKLNALSETISPIVSCLSVNKT